MISKCKLCGKEFETKIHNRATCPECAKAIFNRINSTDKTAVCLVCGKIINEKPKRRRRYCSNSCKNIAHYIAFYYAKGNKIKKPRKNNKENAVKARYRRMDNMEMQARKDGMDYGTYTAMLRMNNR